MSYAEQLSKQVYNIAAAYFFLHVDITLFLVNICPDWIGYLFILHALKTIGVAEPSILLLRPLCMILLVWEGMQWLFAVLDFSMEVVLLEVIVFIVQLYFHFQLLTNLASVALRYSNVSSRDNLLLYRTVRTVLSTAVYLLTPWMEYNHWLQIGMISIYVIVGFCFVMSCIVCRKKFANFLL